MQTSRFTIAIFLGIFFISLALVIQLFWMYLTPFVLALVLVSIFYPVYRVFLKLSFGYRYLASILTTFLVVLCVIIPLSILGLSLSHEALLFYERIGEGDVVERIVSLILHSPAIEQFHNMTASLGIDIPVDKLTLVTTELARSTSLMVYNSLSETASNMLAIGFYFVVMVILVFALFVTGDDVKRYIMELSPLTTAEKNALISRFNDISRAVFIGNGFVAIAEGILGGLGFYWFNIGPALLWGLLIAASAFLPVVGAFAIIVPATVMVLLEHDPMWAGIYLAYNLIYLAVMEIFVKSKLIGDKSRLHAILVFLCVLAGVKVYGVLGIFYGPLIMVMFLTIAELYQMQYRNLLSRATPSNDDLSL